MKLTQHRRKNLLSHANDMEACGFKDDAKTLRELLAAHPDHSGDGGENLKPVEPSALASSIAEVEALSLSEDRDLTVSEMESMMLVLFELRRLQAAPVPQDGDERARKPIIDSPDILQRIKGAKERLSDGHALMRVPVDPTDPDCVLADAELEIERLRAALASSKASPQTVPSGECTPVNFMGINPLKIADGASLPMIPDSWRFGFRKTDAGFDFSFQDDGPLVAWEAVKDVIASNKAAAVAVGAPQPLTDAILMRMLKDENRGDPVYRCGYNQAIENVRKILAMRSYLAPPAPIASAEEAMPFDSLTLRNMALEEVAKRVENQFGLGTVADDIRMMKLSSASDEDLKIYRTIAGNYATHPAAAQPSRAEVLEEAALCVDALTAYAITSFTPEFVATRIRALKDAS